MWHKLVVLYQLQQLLQLCSVTYENNHRLIWHIMTPYCHPLQSPHRQGLQSCQVHPPRTRPKIRPKSPIPPLNMAIKVNLTKATNDMSTSQSYQGQDCPPKLYRPPIKIARTKVIKSSSLSNKNEVQATNPGPQGYQDIHWDDFGQGNQYQVHLPRMRPEHQPR